MRACKSRLGDGSRFPDAPSNSRGVLQISPFTRIVKSTSLSGSPDSSTGRAGTVAGRSIGRTESRSLFLPSRQQRIRNPLGGQLRAAVGPVTVGQTIGSTNTFEDLAQIDHRQPVLSQRSGQPTMSYIGSQ
jgi:hypothetical protein